MKRFTLVVTIALGMFACAMFGGSVLSSANERSDAIAPNTGAASVNSRSAQQNSLSEQSRPESGVVAQQSSPTGAGDEEDDPDMPKGKRRSIDEETYLRLRDEYIARRRGLEPGKPFDPQARGRAIRQMETQEALQAEAVKRLQLNRPTNVLGSNFISATWTPIGPAPLPNGSAQGGSIVAVSGRVTSVVVDPTDSNKIYLGTAQGGVWRSLDSGGTWYPIFDSAASLAIGALALAPSSPSTLYVGTGEFNACGDCFFGAGLYRIDNADTVATLVGPINPQITLSALSYNVFSGRGITKIVVKPDDAATIFVTSGRGIGGNGSNSLGLVPTIATRGLYRSTNATSTAASVTFQKLVVTTDDSADNPGTGNEDMPDVVLDPGDPNNLIVSAIGRTGTGLSSGIYRTTNALASTPTFTRVLTLPNSVRANLTINKIGSTVTLYAATSETPSGGPTCTTGTLSGALRKSTDGGATWTSQLAGGGGFCGGQCFYDMTVAVDPNDANVVYLGGSARGTCSDAMKKSSDGGVTFTRDDNGLHADSHALFFDTAGRIFTGNDGGVWRRNSGLGAGSAWTNLNNAPLNTLQFQSIAVHPLDQFFTIGGTQDNGTEAQQASSGNWINAESGDGGYTLIDQSTTNTTNVTMYLTFFNQPNSQIMFDRATLTSCLNVRNSWPTRGAIGCSGGTAVCPDDSTPASQCDSLPFFKNNGIQLTDNVLFYAPMTLGPGAPNTLYFGTDRLYRSTDRGDNMTIVSQSPLQPTGLRTPLGGGTPQSVGTPISTIAIAPQDDNYRIIGLQTGDVWATSTGSSNLVQITGPFPLNPTGSTNRFVGRAVFDPNNKDVAYVAFSFFAQAGQGIWKITNLGAAAGTSPVAPNWVASASGVPSVPINALVIDPMNSNNLYAGTDIGVYNSIDGGNTWNPYGTGLPRSAVFDIAIQSPNRILRLATHGRGMWETSLASAGGPNTVQFSAASQTVTETLNQTTTVVLNVTRAGDLSAPATIDYASADGTASERSDYLAALGTLSFAAGEGSKSITVFIVDDRLGENPETFTVSLSNPVGCTLGPQNTFTVTINSNESVDGLNPVKDASFDSDFFVRQHYTDFLNREADSVGLAFWKNQIDECTTQQCREVRRINVSAAFFVSIEFQETGYLVYKAYQAAFNSGEFLKLRQFLPDTQEIGRGVVIGQPGAGAQLEANKQKFFSNFVQRAAFLSPSAYPTTLTAAEFVDKLNANTFDPQVPGSTGSLSSGQRDMVVAQLAPNPASSTLRAQVLRTIAENGIFTTRQFNKAFVLMQYFGYLRRNPNDAPEPGLDFAGYNFWLGKLNQFNGNYINAEMVKAFITSSEYQQRFGP
jgi:hypothetical protein